MPTNGTTVIAARLSDEDAAAFAQQAQRFGLSRSAALATLVVAALLVEDCDDEPPPALAA